MSACMMPPSSVTRFMISSWVGLDVLEAVCLLIVAALLSRRHPATSPAAAATAAILCMDAWFDTMSAAPQLAYAESLAMACFAELPLAALLAWTAWRTLNWAAPRTTVTPFPADRTAGETLSARSVATGETYVAIRRGWFCRYSSPSARTR